jgi:hypothetical protein
MKTKQKKFIVVVVERERESRRQRVREKKEINKEKQAIRFIHTHVLIEYVRQ